MKLLLGMLFCQSFLGALAMAGWTQRFARRAVLRQWWSRSDFRKQGGSFAEFVAQDTRTSGHASWPNWIVEQEFPKAARGALALGPARRGFGLIGALFGSLWSNAREGVQAMLNVWLLTAPGCALMGFGWYDGWNNSFNKGYEQAIVGPLTVFSGMVLLAAAMMYVPLAVARQAATGEWRKFYDFALVRQLIRRARLETAFLALLYFAVAQPVFVLTIALMFFPQMRENIFHIHADAPEQVLPALRRYFFWTAIYFFPAWVFLRWVAARIYGAAVLKAVQTGAISEEALGDAEWQALHRLELLGVQPAPTRHWLVRWIRWAGTRMGRFVAVSVTVLAWMALIFELFLMTQFFNYRGGLSWVNNSLLQLPWYFDTPTPTRQPWHQAVVAALVVLAAWMITRVRRRWLAWRRNAVAAPPVA
ncbi:MAG TPA: hypothetical protein VHH73_07640 [Verrucomicrobiae bacterium]|nr:hypothetical protein [Verrucomicrobiae bacterium]